MRHWVLANQPSPLPNWQDGLPGMAALAREDAHRIDGEAGIVWIRARAGEDIPVLLKGIMQGMPPHPVVILADDPSEATVLSALGAGAAGCCNTHAAPDVLAQVALVVANGGLWVGQSLLQRLVGSAAQILGQRTLAEKSEDWAALLSERETQVAKLVSGGASNKEIARELEITERTVKAHLTAIFDKLGLRDRLQLSLRVNGLSL